jgi:antitoxin PrlF
MRQSKTLESRITQKGQVTVPAEIRAKLGLKPRDRVQFEVDGGTVRIRPARTRLMEGYGAVEPHARPEDFSRIREEVERAIAAEVMDASQ